MSMFTFASPHTYVLIYISTAVVDQFPRDWRGAKAHSLRRLSSSAATPFFRSQLSRHALHTCGSRYDGCVCVCVDMVAWRHEALLLTRHLKRVNTLNVRIGIHTDFLLLRL